MMEDHVAIEQYYGIFFSIISSTSNESTEMGNVGENHTPNEHF